MNVFETRETISIKDYFDSEHWDFKSHYDSLGANNYRLSRIVIILSVSDK